VKLKIKKIVKKVQKMLIKNNQLKKGKIKKMAKDKKSDTILGHF